jgi:hypothetical protein
MEFVKRQSLNEYFEISVITNPKGAEDVLRRCAQLFANSDFGRRYIIKYLETSEQTVAEKLKKLNKKHNRLNADYLSFENENKHQRTKLQEKSKKIKKKSEDKKRKREKQTTFSQDDDIGENRPINIPSLPLSSASSSSLSSFSESSSSPSSSFSFLKTQQPQEKICYDDGKQHEILQQKKIHLPNTPQLRRMNARYHLIPIQQQQQHSCKMNESFNNSLRNTSIVRLFL